MGTPPPMHMFQLFPTPILSPMHRILYAMRAVPAYTIGEEIYYTITSVSDADQAAFLASIKTILAPPHFIIVNDRAYLSAHGIVQMAFKSNSPMIQRHIMQLLQEPQQSVSPPPSPPMMMPMTANNILFPSLSPPPPVRPSYSYSYAPSSFRRSSSPEDDTH